MAEQISFYKSAEAFVEEMKAAVDSKYSVAKGTWLWEIIKAVALGLSEMTAELEELRKKFYYKELEGDELDAYVENWSYITRKQATIASGRVSFYAKKGRSGVVPAGTYVSSGAVSFITLEDGEITSPGGSCEVRVECIEYGEIGNTKVGGINKLVTGISWIESVGNLNEINGGEDREDDKDLRYRYERVIKKGANAGNKAYYEELALSRPGVGAAFCISCPGGIAGTADLYILNSDRDEASEEVIRDVQKYIDPNMTGDGAGEAAVGAIVTVKTPVIEDVEISTELITESGYTAEMVKAEACERIREYFREAFDEGVVRYNRVGKCILETKGVRDYRKLLVNGDKEDIGEYGDDVMRLYKLTKLEVQ